MKQEFQDLLKKAEYYITIGDFQKAKQHLDSILEVDTEIAEAWYQKTKLPFLQEDIIVYRGVSLSVSKIQSLDVTERINYYRQSGIMPLRTLETDILLNVDFLIEKEHIKYLEKAVAVAKDKKEEYQNELKELKEKHLARGQNEIKVTKAIGYITLPTITILFANLIFAFLKMGLPYLIVSLSVSIVPYVLSIIGLILYTKAKHEYKNSTVGFVFSIVNLLMCNIVLIVGVIFIILK